MTRRALLQGSLLLLAAVMTPLAASGQPPRVRGGGDGGAGQGESQRAGGHQLSDAQQRAAENQQQAAAEGVPEPQANGNPQALRQGGPQALIVPGAGWRLGVNAYNTRAGVVITYIQPGSAAFRAGFEQGDRIVTVGGFQVGIVGNYMFYLGEELQRQADRRGRVELLVQNVRNNRLMNLSVNLDQ